jgi:hypothetical protein
MNSIFANFTSDPSILFHSSSGSSSFFGAIVLGGWVLLVIYFLINLLDAGARASRRFKKINVAVASYIYIVSAFVIYLFGPFLLLAVIIYVVGSMALTKNIIDSAERRKAANIIEFSQVEAINAIGTNFGSFHHIFYSPKHEHVLDSFRQELTSALKNGLGYIAFKEIQFKDVDQDLERPETRVFFAAETSPTLRQTGFVLLLAFTENDEIQGLRWWVLVKGDRDVNKVFWRYVFAPIVIPFISLAYLRRRYEPLNGLNTIYAGFFNSIDILSKTRELHFVTFETLIKTLDKFGIDTSDLKQQKGDILNINVSGGQTSFGSVVQGAFNKVSSVTGSKRS